MSDQRKALGQYLTQEWVAEALWETFDVNPSAVICEPSCGRGAMLKVVPPGIRAYGVELDPTLAAEARRLTGRTVITGDFRDVALPEPPTMLFGNPPFQLSTFEQFLGRAETILPDEDTCRFILPAYFFQTSGTTMRINKAWSIAQQLLPRETFPGLSVPLVFATFTKDRRRTLVGFLLYQEHEEMKNVKPRHLLVGGQHPTPVWQDLVDHSLHELGGAATLPAIYGFVLPKAPETNSYPHEKIRQTLLRGKDRGRYTQPKRGQWALAA